MSGGISIGNADGSRHTLVYETYFLTVNAELYHPYPYAGCTALILIIQNVSSNAPITLRKTESGASSSGVKLVWSQSRLNKIHFSILATPTAHSQLQVTIPVSPILL